MNMEGARVKYRAVQSPLTDGLYVLAMILEASPPSMLHNLDHVTDLYGFLDSKA